MSRPGARFGAVLAAVVLLAGLTASSLLETAALAELQSAAIDGANAIVTAEGELLEKAP